MDLCQTMLIIAIELQHQWYNMTSSRFRKLRISKTRRAHLMTIGLKKERLTDTETTTEDEEARQEPNQELMPCRFAIELTSRAFNLYQHNQSTCILSIDHKL